MEIERQLIQSSPARASVLTIGVFDGVHRGHRHLIDKLRHEAAAAGALAGVVTLRNHPASVLRGDFEPRYLTSLEERTRLLEEAGVELIVPITFDAALSQLSASDFVSLLVRHLKMRGLVIGPDFAMGRDREGTAETLVSLGAESGFGVKVVDPLVEGGQVIRSTFVREALGRGDVSRVEELLGRRFTLTGRVVKGLGRGEGLGFPTANLEAPHGLAVPGNGIYAAWAYVDEGTYMAATSIGDRPTFSDAPYAIEAFILDFDGDLYGRDIRLEFVRRLRDEVRFDSVAALQEQVDRDVDETRATLADRP
jgi:riboflavin kinase/FMN adenylyltransferase